MSQDSTEGNQIQVGVVAGAAFSQNRNAVTGTVTAPTAGSALSEALGQQLGQATAQMISKNLNIAPTGTRQSSERSTGLPP